MEKVKNLPIESFSVRDTAKIMGASEHTVRNLIKDGKLHPMRLATLSIPMFEIMRFMKYAVDSQIDFKEYGDPNMIKKRKNNLYKFNSNR